MNINAVTAAKTLRSLSLEIRKSDVQNVTLRILKRNSLFFLPQALKNHSLEHQAVHPAQKAPAALVSKSLSENEIELTEEPVIEASL